MLKSAFNQLVVKFEYINRCLWMGYMDINYIDSVCRNIL